MRKFIIGDRAGRWTLLEKYISNSKVFWICECECGIKRKVRQDHLSSGRSSSCGCRRRDDFIARITTHGLTNNNKRLHGIWRDMIYRCYNEDNKSYCTYGARGIIVCSEWHDFSVFVKWSKKNGYTDTLTIDRIDNDGNYEPSNCQWISRKDNIAKRPSRKGIPIKRKIK